MMSMSLEASCLRIANINSCLRIVDAFSTLCSSAKPSNSTGDLDLRSWSFISRMRAFPVDDRLGEADPSCDGEKSQIVAEAKRLWLDTTIGSLRGQPSAVSTCVW